MCLTRGYAGIDARQVRCPPWRTSKGCGRTSPMSVISGRRLQNRRCVRRCRFFGSSSWRADQTQTSGNCGSGTRWSRPPSGASAGRGLVGHQGGRPTPTIGRSTRSPRTSGKTITYRCEELRKHRNVHVRCVAVFKDETWASESVEIEGKP